MRPPGVRLSVRRMMVVLAVLSPPLALACHVVRFQHRNEMMRRSYWHMTEAFNIWLFTLVPSLGEGGGHIPSTGGAAPRLEGSAAWAEVLRRAPEEDRPRMERATRRIIYHQRMQAKWERAAGHPLVPVPYDPEFPPADLEPYRLVSPVPSKWTRTSP